MNSVLAVFIGTASAASLKNLSADDANTLAQVEFYSPYQGAGIVSASSWGSHGACAPSYDCSPYGYGSWGGSYDFPSCGGCGSCPSCGYGSWDCSPSWGGYGSYGCSPSWGGYGCAPSWGGFGCGYGNFGNSFNYLPIPEHNYSYSPFCYNRDYNFNQNACFGPQVSKGLVNKQRFDDSDSCTNVEEVCISPESINICEDNSSVGGTFVEDINKSCIDQSCLTDCADVAVKTGCCGPLCC